MKNKSKLIIGISSRALFNLDQSHEIYEKEGLESYRDYQIANEDKTLEPGEAFGLVKKILEINNLYENRKRIEVILLSRNTSDTGLRIRNSIESHGLDISRAAFCGGESPHRYVKDFGVHLFLSSSMEDVKLAIDSNVAAATIISQDGQNNFLKNEGQLKIAFDGDAVIFSDDSEKVFHEKGLNAFIENEVTATSNLKEGPFKSFLVELNDIQNDFDINECPIRTALVTARSAPSDKRVIRTLREWGVRIDESLFLGGMSKKDFLKSFSTQYISIGLRNFPSGSWGKFIFSPLIPMYSST